MAQITVKDLKTKKIGTPCGSPPQNETALSHTIIVDFLNAFFDGVLDEVEVEEENGCLMVLGALHNGSNGGGFPTIKNLAITNAQFKHFCINQDIKETVKDLCDLTDEDIEDVYSLDEDIRAEIICLLFSCLVGEYGGSFRADYMGDGQIDLESE